MEILEIQKQPLPIRLRISGEIRFGPVYYSLEINGNSVRNRIFGNEFCWDPDQNLLALEEWYSTSGFEGPITGLTLINLNILEYAQFQKFGGFINKIRFDSENVVFVKNLIGTGKEIEVESTISKIRNWKPIVFDK